MPFYSPLRNPSRTAASSGTVTRITGISARSPKRDSKQDWFVVSPTLWNSGPAPPQKKTCCFKAVNYIDTNIKYCSWSLAIIKTIVLEQWNIVALKMIEDTIQQSLLCFLIRSNNYWTQYNQQLSNAVVAIIAKPTRFNGFGRDRDYQRSTMINQS